MALAVPGAAQSPGRRLHREIPGDLGLGAMPAGSITPPGSAQELAATSGLGRLDEAARPGERILHPQENWSASARSLDRDTRSRPGEELRYQEVFNPSISPFKRQQAYDAVDEGGRLVVRDPSLRPMAVGAAAAWGNAPSARFTGEVLIELSPQSATPIPSVAAEQRVVSYRTVPETPLAFFEDSAGNAFVRAPVTELRRVRLAYVVEAPQRAFTMLGMPSAPLSTEAAHRGAAGPLVPEFLRDSAGDVLRHVGVSPDAPMAAGVSALAGYFRAFRDAELPAGADAQLYRALALGGVGACRHRAYAFVLTLHALEVNARFVSNEAHAWAEVAIPGQGWSRVDLGGWDVPLRTEAPTDRETFVPANPDPLPRPPGYGQLYSSSPSPTRADQQATSPSPPGPGDDPAAEPTASGAATSEAAAGAAARGAGAGAGAGLGGAGEPAATGGPGEPAVTTGPGLRADAAPDERGEERVGTTLRVTGVRAADGGAVTTFVRGTLVEVSGEAQEESGAPAASLPVTFELWRGGRAVRVDRGSDPTTSLGTAVTGDDGRFSVRVLLPVGLDWGGYDLRARTPGDTRRLPARSE
jgi:transglutaminase-like putative cysteine protease